MLNLFQRRFQNKMILKKAHQNLISVSLNLYLFLSWLSLILKSNDIVKFKISCFCQQSNWRPGKEYHNKTLKSVSIKRYNLCMYAKLLRVISETTERNEKPINLGWEVDTDSKVFQYLWREKEKIFIRMYVILVDDERMQLKMSIERFKDEVWLNVRYKLS
jgi:hypothetical protein